MLVPWIIRTKRLANAQPGHLNNIRRNLGPRLDPQRNNQDPVVSNSLGGHYDQVRTNRHSSSDNRQFSQPEHSHQDDSQPTSHDHHVTQIQYALLQSAQPYIHPTCPQLLQPQPRANPPIADLPVLPSWTCSICHKFHAEPHRYCNTCMSARQEIYFHYIFFKNSATLYVSLPKDLDGTSDQRYRA
jgi:hypothetical protein